MLSPLSKSKCKFGLFGGVWNSKGLPILGFRVFKFDIPDSTTVTDADATEAELVFEGPHNSIGAKIEKLQPESSYQFAVECFNGIGMCVTMCRPFAYTSLVILRLHATGIATVS